MTDTHILKRRGLGTPESASVDASRQRFQHELRQQAWAAVLPTAETRLCLMALIDSNGDELAARELLTSSMSDSQIVRSRAWLSTNGYLDDSNQPQLRQ